ncbi:hypothetical protein KP509_07G014300 [Ceratopteris richardii]|nr:hypothetical protein KP509_07G014300 [Ceratopteris richardii]KAH7432241.1 hypothetical protein KP509_07G014300 [Ceratopteris richardii]
MASTIEVYGTAAPGSGSPSDKKGPCPFTQGVMMALEERNLNYSASYIEEGPNKPDWFLKNNPSGTLPAIKDGDDWVVGFDNILQHLNTKYPEQSEGMEVPSSLQPDIKRMSEALYDTFIKWLESKNKFAQAGADYQNVVKEMNKFLQGKRMYMAGSHPTDADCDVFPKIRHARTALRYFMEFEIPLEFASVHTYIELMGNRESVRRTDSPDKDILDGYQKMFNLEVPVSQLG